MHWQGEFAFGEAWLAFRGASADNRAHAHAAVQVVAAHEPLTVTDGAGRAFTGSGWVIRSGVRHRLGPAQRLTLLLADPQSRLATGLLDALPPDPIAALPRALQQALTANQPLPRLLDELQRQPPGAEPPLDPRLAAALELLTRETRGDAVAAASAHAGLSPSRLRALTQARFGIPFAKLLQWRKVRLACLALARGASLAEAAVDAGFADQAHLTRTMSRVMGLTPGRARAAGRP
jgi:AraC family transcriptional regulator of arabinose operon